MLNGKTALVTGSTSGIGLGIARAFAGQGANGFRVVDVWESEEAFRQFGEKLMPIMGELGIARVAQRVGRAVRRDYPEIVQAIRQNVAVEDEGVLEHVGPQELPLALVFAPEIERIDQAIAIGIVGLPGDLDLRGASTRYGLGGRSG